MQDINRAWEGLSDPGDGEFVVGSISPETNTDRFYLPATRSYQLLNQIIDSLAAAHAAHDGPAYQEALRVLGDGAERDFRIAEGV